ncbi:MAG: hypothetical protein JWO30_2482 [Fibrobacteres bacterium]|nr:hypothetical protein [Fibrobacterota bacterium]
MTVLATMVLIGCASAPGKSPAAAGTPRVDAILPSGRNLFVFDFSQSRYQKWTLSRGPADSLGLCRVLDTLAGNWGDASHWLALPSPSQPFSPMLAVWGPSGNFFLLDRAGKRLNLYDTSAQFLSSFPLPAEIRERNLDRFEVFWTRDGQFSFLDLGEGKVWQYAELRSAGDQGDWRLRNTVHLPVGLEACLWEPFFRDPCCIQNGKGVCFDKYFNPVAPWPGDSGTAGLRPGMTADASEWKLILDGGAACGSRPPVCFQPDKGLLSTCPAETDAALPR